MKTKNFFLPYFSSDLTSVSSYARSMQRQQTAYGNPVTGQHLQSYNTVSRRRPPAIPVRSQVAANNLLSPQQSAATVQRFAGMSVT